MPVYTWIVFAHLIGVFGFLLAHGASASVALRLRHEHDPGAVRALLALSAATRSLMYGSLAVLGVAGVVAGYLGGWWREGWTWASVGVLVAMTLAVVALGTPYFRRLRKAAELVEASAAQNAGGGDAANELRALLHSPRPLVVSAVGALGLVVLLWLMVLKPF